MAVRFDASGDYLRRTANLPADNSYTICGWARLVTDTNNYSTLCSIESATTSAAGFHLLSTDVDGTSLKVWNDGGAGTTIATLTTGTAFFWALVADGRAAGNIRGYYRADGTNALSTQNASTGATSFTSAALYIANDSYTEPFSGRVWNVKVWDRALSASELLIESFYERPQYPASLNCWWPLPNSSDTADRGPNARNPTVGGTLTTEDSTVVLWRPKIRTFVPVSAATGYTLAMGQGSYSLTGQTATLTYSGANKTLAMGQGSYTLTGQAAGTIFGRKLAMGQGAYTLTGSDALADYAMSMGQGSYTLTGQDATLTYTPAGGAFTLTADSGTYSLTGQSTGLLFGHKLAIGQGSYSLTGQNLAFGLARIIAAGQGAYSLSGQDILLSAPQKIVIETGFYTLTGNEASLRYSGTRPASAATGRGRNYIIKGKRYYNLTNEELAFLLARDLIDVQRTDVKVTYKNKKPHMVSKAAWDSLQTTLKDLEQLIAPPFDEDDEESAAMLLL